jgi:hypothetical protein
MTPPRQLIIEWESMAQAAVTPFGPDGMLYLSSGDGTSDSDGVTGQASRISTRAFCYRCGASAGSAGTAELDPRAAYSIPKDNPFLNILNARGELWCYGLRNPWRIQFDPAGRLWTGDIGQDLWEMIIVAQRGANYGWADGRRSTVSTRQRRRGPLHRRRPLNIRIPGRISPAGSFIAASVRASRRLHLWRLRHWPHGARYGNGRIEWNELIADTPNARHEDARGEMFYADCRRELEPSPPSATTTVSAKVSGSTVRSVRGICSPIIPIP